MSKQEGHPIRNGTIAAVLAGLILSVIPHTRRIAVAVLGAIWSAVSSFFVYLWQYLTSKVDLPWFLVWLLIFAAVPTVWRSIARFLPREKGPQKTDYQSDLFFGVSWTWDYGWGDSPTNISPFCPVCATRLVYMIDRFDGPTNLHCETCNKNIREMQGKPEFIEGTIARQIERKLNSGEWKRIVEVNAEPKN